MFKSLALQYIVMHKHMRIMVRDRTHQRVMRYSTVMYAEGSDENKVLKEITKKYMEKQLYSSVLKEAQYSQMYI